MHSALVIFGYIKACAVGRHIQASSEIEIAKCGCYGVAAKIYNAQMTIAAATLKHIGKKAIWTERECFRLRKSGDGLDYCIGACTYYYESVCNGVAYIGLASVWTNSDVARAIDIRVCNDVANGIRKQIDYSNRIV